MDFKDYMVNLRYMVFISYVYTYKFGIFIAKISDVTVEGKTF